MTDSTDSRSSRWDALRFHAWRLDLDPEPLIAEATRRAVTSAELVARFERSLGLIGAPLENRLAADAMTPGLLYIELLWQDTLWVDRLGRIWEIKSPGFTTDHLLNVMLMLRELAVELYLHFPGADVRASDRTADDWLSTTPLMHALQAEVDRRATAEHDAAAPSRRGRSDDAP